MCIFGILHQRLARDRHPGRAQHLLHPVLVAEVVRDVGADAREAERGPGSCYGLLQLLEVGLDAIDTAELPFHSPRGVDQRLGRPSILDRGDRGSPAAEFGRDARFALLGQDAEVDVGQAREARQHPARVAAEEGRDEEDGRRVAAGGTSSSVVHPRIVQHPGRGHRVVACILPRT